MDLPSRFEAPPNASTAANAGGKRHREDSNADHHYGSGRGVRRIDDRGYGSKGSRSRSVSYQRQSSADGGRIRNGHRFDRSSDSYYGRDQEGSGNGSFSRHIGMPDEEVTVTWTCKECRATNKETHDYCRQCDHRNERRARGGSGSSINRRSDSPSSRRHRSSSSDDRYYHEDDVRRRRDGRNYYGFSDGSGRKRDSERKKRQSSEDAASKEWPPPFESAGASYVFDSRSGFFYEVASNFFYDPKTKLYFGNKQQKYYQYNPEENPPFREVSHQDEQQGGSVSKSVEEHAANDLVVKALGGAQPLTSSAKAVNKKSDKKKIAICLKKKSSGIRSTSGSSVASNNTGVFVGETNTDAGNSSQVKTSDDSNDTTSMKKHKADMEKWSQRGREMRKEKNSVENDLATSNKPATKVVDTIDSNIKTTVTGKPICMLCKRKFADLEKLKQHVEMSNLHKQNVAKKEAAEEKKKQAQASAAEYRDRAKERRTLYGPDQSSINSRDAPVTDLTSSISNPRPVTATEVVAPDQNLGESNIGNKLLQKLGWKGGSLGRPDGQNQNGGNVADKLKQDWERIETMASNQR